MLSNHRPGLYHAPLLPVGPDFPDGDLPGFQVRFQALLADAENRYGPRDSSWNLLGLEVVPLGHPPAVATSPGAGKNCVLRIALDSAESPDLLDWQLSHEVVHLLGPRSKEEITVFEEGVASYNQHRIRLAVHGRDASFNQPQYADAFNLVRPWLDAYPDRVRQLRATTGGGLSPLTHEALRATFPGMTSEISQALAAKFYPPRLPISGPPALH